MNRGMLTITEDDDFYFDAEAGERPIRFIEKFCKHSEGTKLAGQPFLLEEIQKRMVRDVFGWKWKHGELAGRRRFTDWYFEGAIGCGKSPLLAGIGLYMLMGDGEPGAQVYSLASKYKQAKIVFDGAKSFIASSPPLASRLKVVQFQIRHKRSRSFWDVLSGKGPGAGCRPTCILADEVHDWVNAVGYDALRQRMFKREQPLLIAATNAGESRASFCWQLREKAVAALNGKGDKTLYPVIWGADESAKTDDPEAWQEANPLIGITISREKIRQKCKAAMEDPDPSEEVKFRRLDMSIWPKTAGGRWLDLHQWDAATKNFNASDHSADPLYVGMDLSQGDDLCAVIPIWMRPEHRYIGAKFWMPQQTAKYYHDREAIQYLEWGEQGHIEIVPERTINVAVRKRIAQYIIALKEKHNLIAVYYDRTKADDTIAELEAAGTVCVPIAQGYTVAWGCFELERGLKEQTVTIVDNPVLRFCAENTEVKGDDRGNIWPVKPNAKGRYAGKRGAKIDGITATVTALTEARKHHFPPKADNWVGGIAFV